MLKVKKARAAEAGGNPTAQFVDRMEREDQPVTVRIDDRPPLVIEDARAYQLLWELVDRIETIAAVREGLEQDGARRGSARGRVLRGDAPEVSCLARGMRFRVIILPAAESDIADAADWIPEHSPIVTARWLEGIRAAINTLSGIPLRCPVAGDDFGRDVIVRQLFYGRRNRTALCSRLPKAR